MTSPSPTVAVVRVELPHALIDDAGLPDPRECLRLFESALSGTNPHKFIRLKLDLGRTSATPRWGFPDRLVCPVWPILRDLRSALGERPRQVQFVADNAQVAEAWAALWDHIDTRGGR